MPALASMELVTDLTIFIAILVLIDYCLAVADCVSNPFCFNFVILNKKIFEFCFVYHSFLKDLYDFT